jgi:hypothetical protein
MASAAALADAFWLVSISVAVRAISLASSKTSLEMEMALDYLLDRFSRIDHAGDPPPDEGFVLRSAPRLDLVLHPG